MKSIVILFMLSLFLLIACDDDPSDTIENYPDNTVIIQDDILQSQTWYVDSVYLIKSRSVYLSGTLTIQPGTVVKFHPGNTEGFLLNEGGKIIAQGTPSSPIMFTSFKDDAGGDTNGEDNEPERGDWTFISTNMVSGCVFEYCHFLYGGGMLGLTSKGITLRIFQSYATIKNCIFGHNTGRQDGNFFGALDLSAAQPGTVFTNNQFYDNILPLSIGLNINIDPSNEFNVSARDPNQFNAIFVLDPTIQDNVHITWQETDVAFVIPPDHSLFIRETGSLTLGNNVTIKLYGAMSEIFLFGSLNSSFINYDGTEVYFTSWLDDNLKGDSNGDGMQTSPEEGDWKGIGDVNGYFDWDNILYQ